MSRKLLGLIFLTGILLMGCAQLEAAAVPVVSFITPPEGATISAGEPVNLGIASSDESGIGIVRIELYVEGEFYITQASYSGAVPAFNANIAWVPAESGEINLMAIAYAADDTVSAPATLSLQVTGEAASTEEESPGESEEETTDEPSENPPAPTQQGSTTPFCGDGSCNPGETCSTCPADCGQCCGNAVCEPNLGETCQSCETDCGPCCGNGLCDYGETFLTCIADCEVLQISLCGDGNCDEGESWLSCPGDCPIQIITICGDGICNGDEDIFNCMDDCWVEEPVCGNGICETELGESWTNCMPDCPQY